MATRIEGVTDLPSFIRAASNDHWIWTGSNYSFTNYSYHKYRGLVFNVPQTLATFPIADDRGFAVPCFHKRCVNPHHAITLPATFYDLARPVEMLARFGPRDCKTFIPKPLELKSDIIEFAYNPDPEIWAHRVRSILKCSPVVARELISA